MVNLINRDKIFWKFTIISGYVIIILQIINALTLKDNDIKFILWGMMIFNLIVFACNEIITIINFTRFYKGMKNEIIISQQEKNDRKN